MKKNKKERGKKMMGAQFVLFFPGYKYVGTRASQMV